jgi:4-hydroxyphenylpyruvate dioxygenase
VEKVCHPNLGLCLDTYLPVKVISHESFHIYCLGDNVDDLHIVPGDKIFTVQFADAPLLRMEPLQYSRHHRNFPYQGQFPLTKFVHALKATGYEGPYSLEIFNDEFRSAPCSRIALDGYRSLLLLQEKVHKSLIPVTPRTVGVEFIEFACSPSEMNALERFIADRLGFRKIGQHRSKSVYLYRQGQTHFILNSHPESHASAFHLDHGVSVCAIAISVDDVTLAIERAAKLKYQVISQNKRGLGELQLVAIQAPNESLIYLLDASNPTSFLSDFILEPDIDQPKVTVKVDYISQVLDPGDMDKTVLFYHALFGLEAQQQLFELNDPRGVVRSRAMTSKCGTVRIYLNVSAAESTVVGRFLSHSGSGIHHVALGTDDIFSTLDKIGNSFLPLPRNYFDDLSLRYDLSQATLRKLYEANVMYDADADGEFLHACTDTFDERFFFEMVERRTGYSGFGGLDAMVRTVFALPRVCRLMCLVCPTGTTWTVTRVEGVEGLDSQGPR